YVIYTWLGCRRVLFRSRGSLALQGLAARASLVAQLAGGRDEQIAVGALAGAAHAPSELVELGEPEQIRPIHDHRVGARDVEAARSEECRGGRGGWAAEG